MAIVKGNDCNTRLFLDPCRSSSGQTVVLSALRADTHEMGGRWQGAVPHVWQQLAQDTLGLLAGECGPAAPPPSTTSGTGMQDAPSPGVISAPLVAPRSAAGSLVLSSPRAAAPGSTGEIN